MMSPIYALVIYEKRYLMKKFLLPLFALLLFIPLNTFAQNPINICINDYYLESDVDPVIDHNRVLVPIRVISENLGAQVEWNQKSKKVRIHFIPKGSQEEEILELTLNRKTLTVLFGGGGETQHHTMDVTPKVINNRVLVPIRFISEFMEKPVHWDQANQTVAIGEAYHPIQKRENLQIQWKGQTFPVRSLQIANRPFVSLPDFSQKMNWTYTIDRETYNFGGGGIGIILRDPSLGKKIIFHSRGTECDGVAIDTKNDYSVNQIYYNREFYIPLDELILGFRWNASYNPDHTLVSLQEKEDNVTYQLFYDLLDPSSSLEEIKYMRIPSKLYTVVYKNNHFVLMPMNRTLESYLNEWDHQIEQGISAYIEDDAHLYGCSVFFLNEENKTIIGIQAN